MSECAAKYAIAIVSPWDPRCVSACIPNTSRPTYKMTAYSRGTVVIGTAGFGFLAYAPCLAKDFAAIYYSNNGAAYAGTQIITGNTMPPGTAIGLMTNLPFTRAQLIDTGLGDLPEVMGRIVSSSISIKYTGTELNRGGQVLCFAEPAHDNVHGAALADWLSRREINVDTPTANRDKCWVVTYGLDENEREFGDAVATDASDSKSIARVYPFSRTTPCTPASPTNGAAVMGIMLSGVAGTTFEYNIIQHNEFIGIPCDPFLSPTISDPAGTGLVISSANSLPMLRQAQPKKSLSKIMLESLKTNAAMVGTAALRKGALLAMSALV